jgi:hypothetical protein
VSTVFRTTATAKFAVQTGRTGKTALWDQIACLFLKVTKLLINIRFIPGRRHVEFRETGQTERTTANWSLLRVQII